MVFNFKIYLFKVLFKTCCSNKFALSHVVKEDFTDSSPSRVLGLCDSSQVESFYPYSSRVESAKIATRVDWSPSISLDSLQHWKELFSSLCECSCN